ncbi:MAG: 2-succinyl-5-enolpyruvyl-6-hydroxy-3-cyclohexene-1-carboxylic-acid synthase [Bacteroidales bacterium]|nr:2-succinyl-5-enolpyruvyl-6-hydroxy-3-cyclohexene-1-carboxylic-acid synthase [Bacteroidales bacterium]
MSGYSDKEGINRLADVLIDLGLKRYVISPGSRNAPLIKVFTAHPKTGCQSIVDERSAGYFALGLALRTNEPVGLICTSGTAVLNYGPAIAEAYYRQIPLIAITADRPEELIDQREGQAIRQQEIFKNHVKASCQLPQQPYDEDRLWYGDRLVSETINKAMIFPRGPAHINVPLREPLYGSADYAVKKHKTIHMASGSSRLMQETVNRFTGSFNDHVKIMILTGTLGPNKRLDSLLAEFAELPSVSVLTERTSNLMQGRYHHYIDRLLNAMSDNKADYAPDLLITFGNDVVSKQIKAFLRNYKPQEHWHIEQTDRHTDTYKSLTHLIPVTPEAFFEAIQSAITPAVSGYSQLWHDLEEQAADLHHGFMIDAPWSDLKAFEGIMMNLPQNSVAHLGNSTPVRYALLFSPKKDVEYYANRGTSGIDGVVSTAVGFAHADERINTVVTGDLSFFYDSNALWNSQMPANLRIIVINNQGGSIFRIIPGPDTTDVLESYFETKQDLNIRKMAEVFGLYYYFCDEQSDLAGVLSKTYRQHDKAVVMEIKTPETENDRILKQYFKTLKGD